MIVEKPSIARTITNILSNNEYVEYNFDESINIFAFKGFFKKIYSYFTVTSVKGHLYKMNQKITMIKIILRNFMNIQQ